MRLPHFTAAGKGRSRPRSAPPTDPSPPDCWSVAGLPLAGPITPAVLAALNDMPTRCPACGDTMLWIAEDPASPVCYTCTRWTPAALTGEDAQP